ncbi:DUF6003 family protein [Streptomyces afghaniensis]|uniref:DUF6003 family protein n=1 Tax=Streptomyces afghaniensis TaxID=66865 RepID=UPI0037B4F4A5
MPEVVVIDETLQGLFAPDSAVQGVPSRRRALHQGSPSAAVAVESETQNTMEGCEDALLAYRRCMESRDDLIRRAKAAGLTEVRIAQLTGHSRTTVRAALGLKRK